MLFAARPNANSPVYQAIISIATLGVWLVGFVDVLGQGLFSDEIHPDLGFYPASFYLFTLVFGLAALRRGYGTPWLEGVASGRVTLGVTVVLWLLTILRIEEHFFELPYLTFLYGMFGAPSEEAYTSFWFISFLTLLHSLDAHVAHRRSSRAAWLSYGLLCAIVMLVLHQAGNLALAVDHYNMEGLSLICCAMICSFAGFIASDAPAVGLLYDQRSPKTNVFGMVALVVVMLGFFVADMIVDSTQLSSVIQSIDIFYAGALVLAGLPFALSALRSSELQKRIAAGEMTTEGVLTKFVPDRRYFGNTYRPSGIVARMSVYAVFDAPEWQRYAIQAVVTFALASGAIALGRMASTPTSAIWWANGYLAYCLVLRPKTQWAASSALFYATILFVNLLAGNQFVASTFLSGVNAVEGVVIATLIVATAGVQVHGRQISVERMSVSSYTVFLLAGMLVHAFGSLFVGGFVTLFSDGSLVLNMLTLGGGGLIGSGTILLLFAGKVLEQHLGFKRLEPRIQRFGLFACLYVGTVFALYTFLSVNALLAMPHVLFVVLSLLLVLLPSLYQAGSLFVVTSSIYFYLVQSRLGLEGWLTQVKLTFTITIIASLIGLALVARYVSAKAREAEKRALDLAPNALLTLDAQRRLLTISKNAQEWFDVSEAKLLGRHFDDLFEDFKPHAQPVTDHFKANLKASYTAKLTRTLASGATLTLEVTLMGNDDVSLPYAYVVSVTDVTELESSLRALEMKNIEAEDARAEAEAWLQVLERSPSATLLRDSSFIIRNASHGWTQLTGFSRDETIGREFVSFLVEEERDRYRAVRQEALKVIQAGRDVANSVWTLRTNSGAKLQVTIIGNEVAGPTAQETMSVMSVTNITDLATQKALADTLLNRNAAMVISQSDDWKIQTCSDAWTNQLGYTREETVGHDLTEFMEPEDAMINKEFRETLKSQKASKNVARNTLRFRTKAGELRQIELQSVVTDLEGNFVNIVTLVDITDIMTAQHQLRMLVQHDELTGLYSRRGLKEKFSDGKRNKTAVVYILDLDHFKSVNDSYGHEAGDALLSAMGQTMTRLTETGGCAARLGGEEFAIIRPWQGWKEAKEFGEVLRLALEQTVVVSCGRTISRTASIGIAKLGASEVLSDAMRLADDFAREAKLRGRNMVCAGEEEELRALELRGTFITVEEVQAALEGNEMQYYVQPIWNVEKKCIEGFEALIRWIKPEGIVVMPGLFIGLLYEVTRKPKYLSLKTQLRKDLLSKLSAFPSQYVSFNFTLEQLSYAGAAQDVHQILSGIVDHPGREIVLEISEQVMNSRTNRKVLKAEIIALQGYGYKIALDDFGVEESNLNRMQQFPISILKIDKALIQDIDTSEVQRATLRGLDLVTQSLGIKVIVEGIESIDQAHHLYQMGFYSHQGYLHARPMPPEDVEANLSAIGFAIDAQSNAKYWPDEKALL
jgi:diguanylate cyclase (GGDEF)-like protein/PAS domain S-box-containing protein